MKRFNKYSAVIFLVLVMFMQVVFAAPASSVTNIRFSQKAESVRIVFDVDSVPAYEVKQEANGTKIILNMPNTMNKANLTSLPIKDTAIKSIDFAMDTKNNFSAIITLNRNAVYKVNTLKNPNRVYIDIIKNYDQKIVDQIAPGIQHITLMRGNEKGMITAHVLDIDLKKGYQIKPALANGMIAGRQAVSGIAKDNNAIAAINASYFASNGEILGLTKIDSTIVSTAGLARSALGIAEDGTPFIGTVDYQGSVKLRDGEILPISGVNSERGENAAVLYNQYYDKTTKTNIYGREYVIKDNEVIAINPNNSALKKGEVVLSVHGSSADRLANLQVGQDCVITEDLGEPWNKAKDILGVGPLLVQNGSVYLTTKIEQFGPDVASGRAPRTAVGLTKDGRVLLAVIDGRQSHSIGYTLLELALFMQEMGAVNAVNFDGGGSSEMVIGKDIINSPSDGGERKVGSALVVLGK